MNPSYKWNASKKINGSKMNTCIKTVRANQVKIMPDKIQLVYPI